MRALWRRAGRPLKHGLESQGSAQRSASSGVLDGDSLRARGMGREEEWPRARAFRGVLPATLVLAFFLGELLVPSYLINSRWTAIITHIALTYGLARSPIRDAFQQMPRRPSCF